MTETVDATVAVAGATAVAAAVAAPRLRMHRDRSRHRNHGRESATPLIEKELNFVRVLNVF